MSAAKMPTTYLTLTSPLQIAGSFFFKFLQRIKLENIQLPTIYTHF